MADLTKTWFMVAYNVYVLQALWSDIKTTKQKGGLLVGLMANKFWLSETVVLTRFCFAINEQCLSLFRL